MSAVPDAQPPVITVYVSPGDPASAALRAYLDERDVAHTVRDVREPDVQAFLMAALGRVAVPVTQIGGKMLVGFDPLQIARHLPQRGGDEAGVSFGAAVRTVTGELAAAAGLPAAYGVEVGSVKDASAAAVAGIRSGDIITEIGGYTITGGRDQFIQAISVRRPGDTMELTIWRAGESTAARVAFPLEATAV